MSHHHAHVRLTDEDPYPHFEEEEDASSAYSAVGATNTHWAEATDDKLHVDDTPDTKWIDWRKLWTYTGPGWLMSIAYLDPGNLESDLQAGAIGGYSLIWVLWWSTVMGLLVQVLSARVGVVTGKDLATNCRERFPKPIAYFLWLMVELAIIASDVQEVIGSAIAFRILFGLPLYAGVLITAVDTFVFLLLHVFGVRKLEAFFAVLIFTMLVCFWIVFGTSGADTGEIFYGWWVPTIEDNADVKEQASGIVGAVIMPHNLYLHSALVLSRDVNRKNPRMVKEANKYFAIEAGISLLISFAINLSIMAVFAAQFHGTDKEDIGLYGAGEALAGKLGESAKYVWAVGLLAAGQSSTMTGAYAGQFVMEGFLDIHVVQWARVLFTRSVAIVPAVLVATLACDGGECTEEDDTFDVLNKWLNVGQAFQLPFAVLPVLLFTCSDRIMGDFKTHWFWMLAMWLVSGLVISINVSTIIGTFDQYLPNTTTAYVCTGLGLAVYSFVVCWQLYQAVLVVYRSYIAPLMHPREEKAFVNSAKNPLLPRSSVRI